MTEWVNRGEIKAVSQGLINWHRYTKQWAEMESLFAQQRAPYKVHRTQFIHSPYHL
jgi:hypothetical protein